MSIQHSMRINSIPLSITLATATLFSGCPQDKIDGRLANSSIQPSSARPTHEAAGRGNPRAGKEQATSTRVAGEIKNLSTPSIEIIRDSIRYDSASEVLSLSAKCTIAHLPVESSTEGDLQCDDLSYLFGTDSGTGSLLVTIAPNDFVADADSEYHIPCMQSTSQELWINTPIATAYGTDCSKAGPTYTTQIGTFESGVATFDLAMTDITNDVALIFMYRDVPGTSDSVVHSDPKVITVNIPVR